MSTTYRVGGVGRFLSLTLLLGVGFACANGLDPNNPDHGSGNGNGDGNGNGSGAVDGGGNQGSGASTSNPGVGGNGQTGDIGQGGNAGTGTPSGTAGLGSSAGGAPAVCEDNAPPGAVDCATWQSWGQCGTDWFKTSKFCEITCGVCSAGTPAGTAGTGSTGTPGAGGSGAGTSTGSSGSTAAGGRTETPFVTPDDAQPTPESSGISGAFRVDGQGHLTHNGTPFQVRGGNWFGLEGQDDNARPGAMELYIGAVFWADEAHKRTMAQTMDEITAAPLSFNTVRVPVAPQTLVPNHPDGLYSRTDVQIRNNDPAYYPYTDALSALEDFLVQLSEHNLYVILDLHSCSNHIGWRAGRIDDGPPWVDANRENYKYKKEDYTCKTGEDAYDKTKWLADIHTLAALPKKLGIQNVIGVDCFNEPWKYSWSEWADLAKECYDAVAAEDDDLIAIVEGISGSHEMPDGTLADEPYGDVTTNPNWGENLYGQQFDPIQIPKDRLCFSPHTYGPAVYVQRQFIEQTPTCAGLEDDAAGKAKCNLVVERSNTALVEELRQGWDNRFGYLHDQGYCVIIGEFGGHTGWPFNNPVKPQAATIWAHLPKDISYDWEWQNIFVDYLNSKGMTDFTYWSINPESGDTGGLYNHAYTLSNESGWGQWLDMDMDKANMLSNLR